MQQQFDMNEQICSKCQGSGSNFFFDCDRCKGSGKMNANFIVHYTDMFGKDHHSVQQSFGQAQRKYSKEKNASIYDINKSCLIMRKDNSYIGKKQIEGGVSVGVTGVSGYGKYSHQINNTPEICEDNFKRTQHNLNSFANYNRYSLEENSTQSSQNVNQFQNKYQYRPNTNHLQSSRQSLYGQFAAQRNQQISNQYPPQQPISYPARSRSKLPQQPILYPARSRSKLPDNQNSYPARSRSKLPDNQNSYLTKSRCKQVQNQNPYLAKSKNKLGQHQKVLERSKSKLGWIHTAQLARSKSKRAVQINTFDARSRLNQFENSDEDSISGNQYSTISYQAQRSNKHQRQMQSNQSNPNVYHIHLHFQGPLIILMNLFG